MLKRSKPHLRSSNLLKARKLLLVTVDLLDKESIPYHLEGGTLLGIVRDNDLLPWDYDVDISIPSDYVPQFLKVIPKLRLKGYRVSIRRSAKDFGPIKKGDYSIFKIKPYFKYILHWFLPLMKRYYITLDVFVKTSDEHDTYWQAQGKVLKVSNMHYQSHEQVTYLNREFSVPNDYKGYLTEKYGDWTVPVKEWKCRLHEKTICG